MRVLFVSHSPENCGVGQYGFRLGSALEEYAKENEFTYGVANDTTEYYALLALVNPELVIYNWYPSTMPWFSSIAHVDSIPKIGVIHEAGMIDDWRNLLKDFDYLVHMDPTYAPKDPRVFTTGFPIREYTPGPPPKRPTFGSFGFGFWNKGFPRVVAQVQEEYDDALIRLHIPFAKFGDADGLTARAVAQACRDVITKPNIELQVTHDFITEDELLDFLAGNSMNCFFYDTMIGRGVSGAVDYAIAARRPVALSQSNMFRHIKTDPTIRIEESSLHQILKNGIAPLEPLLSYTYEKLAGNYENIISVIQGMRGS